MECRKRTSDVRKSLPTRSVLNKNLKTQKEFRHSYLLKHNKLICPYHSNHSQMVHAKEFTQKKGHRHQKSLYISPYKNKALPLSHGFQTKIHVGIQSHTLHHLPALGCIRPWVRFCPHRVHPHFSGVDSRSNRRAYHPEQERMTLTA